jgi:hypothetical protein
MSGSVNIHGLALKAATTLTLDTGAAIITQNAHIIAAESGTADDLDTLNLGYDNLSIDSIEYWPLLFLRADAGDTITIKHGTGNFDLPGDTDIDLVDDSWQLFIYDGTNWGAFVATAL